MTNFDHDSSQLSSSPNSKDLSRYSCKPIVGIKQLQISWLNGLLSTDASSFIQLSTTQQPSLLHNTTGQSMIKNCLLLWTAAENGEIG